jgi:hypothetical protein
MAAPIGNQNALKKRRFTEVLERALLTDDGAKLRALADTLIAMAEGGDLGAIRDIFDRLEGKPRQAVEHSGRMTLEQLVMASMEEPAAEGKVNESD